MTWKDRIEAAKDNGSFSDEDKALARSWETCAVGENLPAVKVSSDVKRLGEDFNGAVQQDDVRQAEHICDRIVQEHFCPQCSQSVGSTPGFCAGCAG